jgi:hypothetical protein
MGYRIKASAAPFSPMTNFNLRRCLLSPANDNRIRPERLIYGIQFPPFLPPTGCHPGRAGAGPLPVKPPRQVRKITRLIVGSNPFYGYSHFNQTLAQLMREWYTQDRKMEVLHACESARHQYLASALQRPAYRGFQALSGRGRQDATRAAGRLALMKDPKLLPEVAKLGPLAIGHHGGRTDERFRNGEKDKIKDFLKAVRDAGVMVGLSTHNPAVVDTAEGEGWDVDYQCRLYRVSRTPEEARAEFGESPIGDRSWRRIRSA